MLLLVILVEESVNEMGMGNKEDKFFKNKVVLDNMLGVEDFIIIVLIGDGGMVFFEYLLFGVIGLVVLSINLMEIIINNSISMLVVGNSVYFSLYLGVKKVFLKLISLIEEIVFCCCGICNLVVIVVEFIFEVIQQMMVYL